MSALWLESNKCVFVRDLLRDFCEVYAALAEQNTRFALSGTISHAVLRDLLGREMRKGVFWRLKDTAHHLFRVKDPVYGASLGDDTDLLDASASAPQDTADAAESMLDWCIGYAFHECVKLKEDAFQRQHYANRLTQMRGQMREYESLLDKLAPLTDQTRESIGREMARILHVLDVARELLIHYLRTHGDNGYVARFLVAEESLVRTAFGEDYAALLKALYAERPDDRCLLAARSCLEAGRPRQALFALNGLSEGARAGEQAVELRRQAENFVGTRGGDTA